MKALDSKGNGSTSLGKYFWVSAICWAAAILGLFFWGMFQDRAETRVLASSVAEAHFQKERAFRFWAASHGGIYVPADERTPPNPILEHVPERDVRTPSGRLLTLIPGFHIVRQLKEEFPKLYGVKGGTISLRPFRAENAPDAWQKRALERFERGEKEVKEFTEISGEPYLRLMRVHPAETGCLKCHAQSGFKEGDVLGGVEVSLPLKPFLHQERQHVLTSAISHGVVFILGLVGLFIGRRRLEQREAERNAAEEAVRLSEANFRNLYENSPVMMHSIDEEGRIRYVNSKWLQETGFSREEVIGKKITFLMTPESAERACSEVFPRLWKDGSVRDVPYQCVTKDGRIADVVVDCNTRLDRSGKRFSISIVRDVTEQKRMEEALHESEERYRELVEISNDIVYRTDARGGFTFINHVATRIAGYSQEELIGLRYTDMILPEYRDEADKFYGRQFVKKIPTTYYEFPFRTKSGEVMWLGQNVTLLMRNEEVVGFQAIARDITEQRRLSAAITRAKEEWERTFDAMPDPVFILDTGFRIVRTNKATTERLGLLPEETIGKTCYEVMHGKSGIPLSCPHSKLLADQREHGAEVFEASMNAVFSVTVSPLFNDDGSLFGSVHVARDITRRKAMEKDLRESEERYRILADNALVGVYLHQGSFFVYANRRLEEMLGWSADEISKMRFWEIFHPDVQEEVKTRGLARYRREEEPSQYVSRILTKGGEARWVEVTATLTEFCGQMATTGAIVDITERVRGEHIMRARLRLMEIADTCSLEELLKAAVDEAEALTGSTVGFYHFVDADEKAVMLHAWSTNTLQKMCTAEGSGRHYSLEEAGVWVDCVRERHTATHNDYAMLPHRKGTPEGHASLVRLLVTPVFRADKIVAILGVGNKPMDYDRNDEKTVEALADLSWDVAEHKRGAESLREGEERYRSLVEESFDGVFVQEGTKIVFANSRLCEMLGYQNGELEGEEHWVVYDPAYRELTRERAQARMRGEEVPSRYEVKLRRRDGASFDGEITARVVILKGKKGVQVWIRDISERKRAEEAIREREEKLRTLMNALPDSICVKDGNGKWQEANENMLRLFDLVGLQYIGKRDSDLAEYNSLYRDALLTCTETDEKAWAAGTVYRADEFIQPPDDFIRVLDVIKLPRFNPDGSRKELVVVGRDISDRKRAEESLRESEERYSSTMNAVGVGIYLIQDLLFKYVNPEMARLHGYDPEEITDRLSPVDLVVPEQCEVVRENLIRRAHGEPGRLYELKCLRKDGSVFDAVVWGQGITYQGRLASVGTLIDITDRKRAEEALQASEVRYRELFEHASDFIYTHDLAGNYTSVNESGSKLLGYSRQELIGLNFRRIVDPEYLSVTEDNLRKMVSEGYEVTGPYEVAVRTKHGERLWLEVTSRIIKKDEISIEVHGIARDITQKKAMETAFHESQMKYESVVESFDGLIYICSQNYEVEFANQRLVERTGYDPVGKKCFEALHDREEICLWCVNERVVRGETVRWETLSPKDNRWYHIVNSPINHDDGTVSKLALIQDITEQKRAEEEKEILRQQLFQSQKMEAIGTLAGGIAHDFNNLLQVISGYSELLSLNPTAGEKTLTGLSHINQAARNGSELVKGLLTLSGRMESQRKPINVNHQVDAVVKLLSRTISKVIELESYLDDALPLINGDPVQVHQILMNLGINARDAMPDGGRLVFETSKVNLDETYCRTHTEVKPGTYVLLSASDTGTGMDQETTAHVFEPFFTTKAVGAGSGLGLSIVYGIVKRHGGTIKCYSEPGRGTTFKVYFPIIEETVALSDGVSREPLPPGGTETILLVDDDKVVRELAESMLVEMGYTVLTAANGKEAVEIYRIEREKISLVILDLIMPEMDGQRCLREILKMVSSARVLIASGHAENGLARDTIERGARGFVHKPYELRQLLQKVRDVLDRG